GFFESRTSDPVRAHQALGFIKKLYEVEEEAHGLDVEARKALRLERAKPILDDIEAWLHSQKPLVLPKSPLGKAIQYALNQWTALGRYVEEGRRAIDNNVAERALRHVVKGRDNWTFAGNDEGGRRAAILFSVVMTCKRHAVDPFAYIRDALTRISTHPGRLVRELLPDRWKAQQAVVANPTP